MICLGANRWVAVVVFGFMLAGPVAPFASAEETHADFAADEAISTATSGLLLRPTALPVFDSRIAGLGHIPASSPVVASSPPNRDRDYQLLQGVVPGAANLPIGPIADPHAPSSPEPGSDPTGWSSTWWTHDSTTAPSERTGVIMAADPDTGLVLLFGGNNASGILGDTWTYDSHTNHWNMLGVGSFPDARWLGAMSFDSASRKFVLFGGLNATTYVNDTWVFDPVNGIWTPMFPTFSPPGTWGATLVYDPVARFHVLYGGQTLSMAASNQTWILDLQANSWTEVTKPTNPGGLFSPRAAYSTSLGSVILFGGGDNSNPPTNGTWSFYAPSKNWSRLAFGAGPPGVYGPQVSSDAASGDILVHGGYNGSAGGHLNTTWRFDPLQSVWTQVVRNYNPGTRSYGGMVQDTKTGKVILVGGHDFTIGNHGDSWWFDAGTDLWRQTPTPSPTTTQHGSVLVYSPWNKRVLRLFGGVGQNELWEIDTAGGTIADAHTEWAPTSRKYHSAAGVDDMGKLVVFGSFPLGDLQTWIYDVMTNNWTAILPPGSPSTRYGASMAYDPMSHRVVMYGGYNNTPGGMPETWLFDPRNMTWAQKTTAASPPGTIWGSMAYDPTNRRIVHFSGFSIIGAVSYQAVWVYDVAMNTWTNATSPDTPRGRITAGAAFDPDSGRMIFHGGMLTTPCGVANDLQETWAMDVRTGRWTDLTRVVRPAGGCLASIAYDPGTHRIVQVGGLSPLSDEIWVFDPATSTWTRMQARSVPAARYNFANGFDRSSGKFVVFSGWGMGADTWTYDSSTNLWTDVSPAVQPPARGGTRMVYDSWRKNLLMFSGNNGADDVWAYDGSSNSWTQKSPAPGPAAGTGHGVSFDESVGKMVIFDGSSGAGETWTYDQGTDSWTMMRPAASPSPRGFNAMVYVPPLRKTLLFSGTNYENDTWLYDAKSDNWTRVAMTGTLPEGRAAHQMAFDGSTGRVIMWGGASLSLADSEAETWAFDPETLTWMELHPRNQPPGREGAGMAFDDRTQRIVLFGGYNTMPWGDTWQFDLAVPPHVVATSPVDGATGVAQNVPVLVDFDMEMDPASTASAFSIAPTVPGSLSLKGRQLEFTHNARFARGTTYKVTIDSSARNNGGDPTGADSSFSFTTLAPPSVLLTDPPNNATDVPLGYIPTMRFSEPMSVSATTGAASISPALQGAFLFSGDQTMLLGHIAPFTPLTKYTVTVDVAATSLTGDNLGGSFSFSFTTAGAAPPRVVSASPPDGSTSVNASAKLVIVFSEPMDANATGTAISSAPTAAWTVAWDSDTDIGTLTPVAPLTAGTKYIITVGTGAKSQLGANMSAPYSWSFTIAPWVPPPPPPPPPPPTDPRVVSFSPPNGEKDVNNTARVVITFSEPMDETATEKAITSDGGMLHTFLWNSESDSVTLTPTTPRKAGTNYRITVSTNASSAYNVTLKNLFISGFTVTPWTAPPPVPQAPAAPGPDIAMLALGLIIGLILGIVLLKVVFARKKGAPESEFRPPSHRDDKAGEKPDADEKKGQSFQEEHKDSKDNEGDGASQRGKGVVKGVGGGSNPTLAAPAPPPPPPPSKDGKPLPYIPAPESGSGSPGAKAEPTRGLQPDK